MSSEVVLLITTAVLAVVAVVAAIVAIRASRQVVRAHRQPSLPEVSDPPEVRPEAAVAAVTNVPARPVELQPRVVEGRVVVPPTRDEVVATALSRPQVRLTVLLHGLVVALRPESRDRVGALMRREYRERRRHRLRAGRRAARAAHLSPTQAGNRWLGELPEGADADDTGGGAGPRAADGTGGGAGPRAAEGTGRAIGA